MTETLYMKIYVCVRERERERESPAPFIKSLLDASVPTPNPQCRI